MASINTSLVLRLSRCVPFLPKTINLRVSPNALKSRQYASEEAKVNTEQSELTENEKKLTGEVEKLSKENETLVEKNKELDDKYKRSLADSDNMRKRLTKQIDDAKIFGIQSFCKDLLEVSDILGHATEAVPKEEINDKNPHLKALYEGLTMTKAQLNAVFKRNGLEQINPIGEKFNPNYHEALFQQEVPNKDSNTVVVVSKIGYKLHERVIRPALVGVSK
ncbi:CLUMA_CG015077, isoform A [Clunio marinus]|uniref:GrpE protein homolog n=1 Tax=Clunio marinus TaxID=568069 RepID=A0A1J1IRB3_9DIPT|nr:CLUMA_CG015077, isoform A [Clunio marinus]